MLRYSCVRDLKMRTCEQKNSFIFFSGWIRLSFFELNELNFKVFFTI